MTSLPSARKDPASKKSDSSRPAAPAAKTALRCPLAVAMFVGLAAAALAGDLVTKHLVFESLLSDPVLLARMERDIRPLGGEATAKNALRSFYRPAAPGVSFSLSTNEGVAFNLPMYRWLIVSATAVTTVLVFYFFATSFAAAHSVHVALGLILGGALGNLYDRLLGEVTVPGFEPIRYQVRDFIDCSDLRYPWVFNVADTWLVVGVGLLIVHWFLTRRSASEHDASPRPAK